MGTQIRKAAVIGAGTMGGGIAAQFANAGIPVILLDTASEAAADRRAVARQGVERQLKIDGFMHPDAAALVTPGNVDDDLGLIVDADWIVEAIIEDPVAKHALFARIDAVRKPDSIVSSNTSTLSRARLCQGMSDRFRRDFAITHFFNPPRHMRLLEVVADERSPVTAASEAVLGKTVITCRDTPGFIANRLGCYWMAMAALEAKAHDLSPEEADSIAGAPFGVPRTGIFGLFDLVGIDLVPLVWGSLNKAMSGGDDLLRYDITADSTFRAMIDAGRFGKKSKAGFYRQSPEDKAKREVMDFASLAYRPECQEKPAPLAEAGGDLRRLCEGHDKWSGYAWMVLKRVVTYAAMVAPEIADDVAAVDTALELGYAWRQGPFALADKVGVGWLVERLRAEGETVPPLLAKAVEAGGFYADNGRTVTRGDGTRAARCRTAGVLSLADIRDRRKPVLENASAALWDIGDGVACLELRTKMNIFDDGVFDLLDLTMEKLPQSFRGLVIGCGDPRAFSAGASLAVLQERLEQGDFTGLRDFVARGQHCFRALKFAPFPVVAAAVGLALGGGCEALLHCDAIVAHAELAAGLPEINVGLIPAWGGCTQLLLRAATTGGAKGPVAVPARVFDSVANARVSPSAAFAREDGVLRPGDVTVMNRDHVLDRARDIALVLADNGYRPPEPAFLALPGATGLASLMNGVHGERSAGRISAADAQVRGVLAQVLTGDGADVAIPVAEEAMYALELEALLELARLPATTARIRHMLATGKPLRN